MADTLNAYIDPDLDVAGAKDGPLTGRTFAAKDLFDIAGHKTGYGCPDWAATHSPADRHAEVVDLLLHAGAHLRGKTHTEELAYALIGENPHYGAPVNSNAPGRVAGGSSSGSAAAVAAGVVDFALGTDTGGSVRIPASFCGIFGLRPTHGRVSLDGVLPLAPGFDTVGWFARTPELMRRVGETLIPDWRAPTRARRLLIAEDAFLHAGAYEQASVLSAFEPVLTALQRHFDEVARIRLLPDGFAETFDLYADGQGFEAWKTLGPWIEAEKPRLGAGTQSRMDRARTITEAMKCKAEEGRTRLRAVLAEHLDGNTILALPAAHGPAPELGETERNPEIRRRILEISALSPLTGVPQYSLPFARIAGAPIGLGLMGMHGADEALLTLAEEIAGSADAGMAPVL